MYILIMLNYVTQNVCFVGIFSTEDADGVHQNCHRREGVLAAAIEKSPSQSLETNAISEQYKRSRHASATTFVSICSQPWDPVFVSKSHQIPFSCCQFGGIPQNLAPPP